MYEILKDARNTGAKWMRDNVISYIIGMQNDLGNDVTDIGYQELQKLLELIIDRHGDMFKDFIW